MSWTTSRPSYVTCRSQYSSSPHSSPPTPSPPPPPGARPPQCCRTWERNWFAVAVPWSASLQPRYISVLKENNWIHNFCTVHYDRFMTWCWNVQLSDFRRHSLLKLCSWGRPSTVSRMPVRAGGSPQQEQGSGNHRYKFLCKQLRKDDIEMINIISQRMYLVIL